MKYLGSIARIGPNLLLTDDSEFLRRISAARSPYTRGTWYDAVKLSEKNHTFPERDERRHNELRAKVPKRVGQTRFNSKCIANSMLSMPAKISQTSKVQLMTVFWRLIESQYLSVDGKYQVMDWADVAQYFTINVLTDIAFSQPLGYLKFNADLFDYVKTIRAFMPVLELQTNFPLVRMVIGHPIVRKPIAPTAKDGFGVGKMIGLAKQVAGERFGPYAKVQNDMLGSFFRHGLTQDELESEAFPQM